MRYCPASRSLNVYRPSEPVVVDISRVFEEDAVDAYTSASAIGAPVTESCTMPLIEDFVFAASAVFVCAAEKAMAANPISTRIIDSPPSRTARCSLQRHCEPSRQRAICCRLRFYMYPDAIR